jgi:phosphohistidine swiveling domain-containing protein
MRRRIIMIAGNIGAPVFVVAFLALVGFKNPILSVGLSCLVGTLGYGVLAGLAALALHLEKRRVRGKPGKVVYSFNELPKEEELSAGGKGRTLARLYQAGYRVPDGFVVLPGAFAGDALQADAWAHVQTYLARLRQGRGDCSFAVRSSAISEDSYQASFAGEFETVLDVRTDEDIRKAIDTVRRSRHAARVQAYIQAQGLEQKDHDSAIPMAVIIQRLIHPDYSGVLFTVDPVTGNLAQMAGNFVQGMGEKLVSGQANAQAFTFDRPKGSYSGPLELARVARELYGNACGLEDELASPQDIEWAVAGRHLYLLQSRPITTLRGYNPVTAEWNDTLQGNFLWSGTNLVEGYPEVMTPFTASFIQYAEENGGPSMTVKNYPLNGVIGGRFYANLSVQITTFGRLFGGDLHRAYRELAGWWGDIPDSMDIPLIPVTTQEWFSKVLPGIFRTSGIFGKYRKKAAAFIADTPSWCKESCRRIQQIETRQALAAMCRDEIGPYALESLFFTVATASDLQVRLERELRGLVGADDANALLSNLGGLSSPLESLGPVMGLFKVKRGEMSREAYLEAYGHRGVNESECAWPRPAEDPAWLDRQLAELDKTTVDIEALFAKQRAAYEASWERFRARYPGKVQSMRRRLRQAAQGAQQREAVRSEATRVIMAVRAFALRAGELLGLGEDVFFLTLQETLACLEGDATACSYIPIRKETYERYRALPPYPTIIKGRFDPFAWATDPKRRSDIYDADAAIPAVSEAPNTIEGCAGALGVVEGTVRRLERLEESDQLQPGEILVTTMTNIGWTPIFPRLAAIVTDLGAPLSHAAIVAREMGIPAVVGCNDATMRLQTGDRVRVDGGKGLVEILTPVLRPQ